MKARTLLVPLRLVRSAASTARFVARSGWMARRIPQIPSVCVGNVTFGPCTPDAAPAVGDLYAALHDGRRLGLAKRLVIRWWGTRLCIIARDARSEEVVGMAMYYFNARDRAERTVHEGFSGLLECFRGRGVGTALRQHALRHFGRCRHLKGVSSRVSTDNAASLKSNLRLGFVEQERYYDCALGVERMYLVCGLDGYRQGLTTENG